MFWLDDMIYKTLESSSINTLTPISLTSARRSIQQNSFGCLQVKIKYYEICQTEITMKYSHGINVGSP
jgi:hypothetical protein